MPDADVRCAERNGLRQLPVAGERSPIPAHGVGRDAGLGEQAVQEIARTGAGLAVDDADVRTHEILRRANRLRVALRDDEAHLPAPEAQTRDAGSRLFGCCDAAMHTGRMHFAAGELREGFRVACVPPKGRRAPGLAFDVAAKKPQRRIASGQEECTTAAPGEGLDAYECPARQGGRGSLGSGGLAKAKEAARDPAPPDLPHRDAIGRAAVGTRAERCRRQRVAAQREELLDAAFECAREPQRDLDAGSVLPGFEPADRLPRDAGTLRQLLLREAAPLAPRAQVNVQKGYPLNAVRQEY